MNWIVGPASSDTLHRPCGMIYIGVGCIVGDICGHFCVSLCFIRCGTLCDVFYDPNVS